MTSTNYNLARKAVLKLNLSELARLRAEIGVLMALPGAADRTVDVEDSRFGLWAINELLTSNGLEPPSLSRLASHRHRSKFDQDYAAVDGYLREAGLDKVQRRTLVEIGLKLLYRNMVELGVPVSGVTLMNQIYRIPSMINKAFPGYAESGLLKMIVRKEEG